MDAERLDLLNYLKKRKAACEHLLADLVAGRVRPHSMSASGQVDLTEQRKGVMREAIADYEREINHLTKKM